VLLHHIYILILHTKTLKMIKATKFFPIATALMFSTWEFISLIWKKKPTKKKEQEVQTQEQQKQEHKFEYKEGTQIPIKFLTQPPGVEISENVSPSFFVGKKICVSGRVCWTSDTKFGKFCKIYDSWQTHVFPLQLFFDKKDDLFNQQTTEIIAKIQKGWYLTVTGIFVESPKVGQPHELKVISLDSFGEVDDYASYLLANDEYTLYNLHKFPEYQAFSPIFSTIWGISSELTKLTHQFFSQKDFSYVYTPLISFSECESGCQPLQLTQLFRDGLIWKLPKDQDYKQNNIDMKYDFFGVPAYTTVSSQLELRTFCPMGNVWTMTTCVRGEPSATRAHLAEFRMVEAEFSSRDEFDAANIAEQYIVFCIKNMLEKFKPYLEFLTKQSITEMNQKTKRKEKKFRFDTERVQKLESYVSKPFVKITHAEAITLLREKHMKKPFKEEPKYTDDLAKEHEIYLTDECFKHPVIVFRFPEKVKAFYMPLVEEELKEEYNESHGVRHVRCFDILVPGVGEIIGGSQRIHNYDELIDKINSRNMDLEPLKFFTEMCRYGSFKHAGFGLGYERFVMLLCSCIIHDTIGFPRAYDGTSYKDKDKDKDKEIKIE
jgi:asparaginyl-tRNA synthetase